MTNKPEVVIWTNEGNLRRVREMPHTGGKAKIKGREEQGFHVGLIRLSDYEALQTECRRLLSDATYSMVHNPVCQREAHGPCMCRDCVLARIGPFVASIQEASQ